MKSRERNMGAVNQKEHFPFVSIIVPVYNDSRPLMKLLKSLVKQSYPKDSFEVIVVDNGSEKDHMNMKDIHSLASDLNIRVECETGIRSSYAARNKGIRAARGEILCFTDADCVANENWIAAGVKTLEEKEGDLVGGKIIFSFSTRKRASEFYDAITNMQIESMIKERGVTITANLFVKKHVFAKIGLFPDQVKSGGDIYFTANAVKNGFKLVYSPDAYMRHPTRRFSRLLKKSIRVGQGKAKIHKLLKEGSNKIPKNVFQGRRPLSHVNPLGVKKRLEQTGYRVGFFKFLAILLVSYCYLFTQLMARLTADIQLKQVKKWASMILTLALVGYIIRYVIKHWESFLILKSIRFVYIIVLFVVFILINLVSAARMLMVMKKFGLRNMIYPHWVKIFMLARFFNRVVPQGGNVFRALTLKKEKNFSLKDYTLSFLSFTWIDFVVIFALIALVVYLFQPGLTIGAIPARSFAILLLMVLIAGPGIFYTVIRKVPAREGEGILSGLLRNLGYMVENSLDVFFLMKNVFLCLFSFGLILFWFYLGFRSVGIEVGIGALSIFVVIMRLALVVTITPGNIGVIEIAYGTLASAIGFDFSIGIIVGGVTRAVSFITIFLLGALWGGIPLLKSLKTLPEAEKLENHPSPLDKT